MQNNTMRARYHRRSNISLAAAYFLFIIALVSAAFAAAVPISSPQSDSVTSHPQQHKSRADDSHHSEAQNPTASSSTAENTHDSSGLTNIMNAMKAQKIDILFQYPVKNRPPIVSRSLQANVQRGSLLLVKAAMEALGIDIKPSFNIKYSGFVSKPQSIQDRFKVWVLKKEDGGGGMDKLIECTGFLKMRLEDKNVEEDYKLVFYGKVIDSKGEPIVTLNHKGQIVPKKRPVPPKDDEPGAENEQKGGKKQRKQVKWADPASVNIPIKEVPNSDES